MLEHLVGLTKKVFISLLLRFNVIIGEQFIFVGHHTHLAALIPNSIDATQQMCLNGKKKTF